MYKSSLKPKYLKNITLSSLYSRLNFNIYTDISGRCLARCTGCCTLLEF
jgi:hypothetical protein